MRSSILSLGLACALGVSVASAAEETAPQATSPEGAKTTEQPAAAAAPDAAQPAAAEATPAAAPVAPKPEAPAAKAPPAHHAVVLGPTVTDAKGQQGRIHTVASGDTLWDISDAYLGTPWVWPSVWKSNAEIENPHRIFPGDKIFVSPNEMRKLTDEEAARMLAGGNQAPAALADGMGSAANPRTYRFAEIDTAGFVAEDELQGLASIIDSHVERVWLGDHDPVIIGLGEGQVNIGDRFDIFRTTTIVNDPETRRPVGLATLALGWLEVTEVHPESATAIIRTSRSEIRRGDRLLPRVKAGSEIPIAAKPEVDGSVVYLWWRREDVGSNDILYLNRGSDDGLQVGSPLAIYRTIGTGIDAAQHAERALPDQDVARVLVIATTARTATAVVTHAKTEIQVGDYFRGSDGIW